MNASLNQHRYVELRPNRAGQDRPYLIGTRLRVQDVVIDHERLGHSCEEIARGLDQITIAQVHGALAYFFENRDFVWQCIREDEAYAAAVREELIAKISASSVTDANDSAIPP